MPLTSLANPRVKRAAKLRKSAGRGGRRETGLFLAEGAREVSRAAAAGIAIEEVFVCEALAKGDAAAAAVEAAEAEGAAVAEVTEAVLRKLAYHREPEGVVAVARRPATGLGVLPAVDAATRWLVAVGTEKPGNLGAMVRTADAAGCGAVLAAGAPVDPFHPNAIRSSTGAVFAVPVAVCGEAEAIAAIRDRGVRVIAAMVDGEAALEEADLAGPAAIVIGPEDAGLGDAWREVAAATGGATVRVTMVGRVADSLNASVTAGVFLFAAASRR